MRLKILDPTIAAEPAESVEAKRVANLDGTILGLLSNGKVNGDRLLELVHHRLAARYRIEGDVTMAKASASRVSDAAMLDALARDCDVVVTAIGD